MEDKKNFGEYIAQKRKSLNLTQEELAEKLYVIPTTISKWERGISYPDITMITRLCRQLGISEHEFFTACDDVYADEREIQARKYNRLTNVVHYSLQASYLIAIVTCFICNLAIDHTLSWFYIVLNSIILAFTITNLPVYFKKIDIKNIAIKILGLATFLIYTLLFTCNLIEGGDWLIYIAYPIVTFELGMFWLGFLAVRYLKINNYFKASIILVLVSIVTVVTNPLCGWLTDIDSDNNISTFLTAALLIIIAFVMMLSGLIKSRKKSN